ncbi:hypothetical protein G8764_04555 [Pseudomaricurvus alcaniphilus]|uniref:hypothetical protein n=1 Tax=Pseudomaricurvus alcaniphilus TaxID=1166482 RepID=UPI00140CFE06|nr:hypothetical protein [Pseudomaricurvus alcaniphilus]NHN36560.1 hypothetical protein [Pseudomaricurvus alcaniphilus]
MVKGLALFREYFQGYEHSYVLIGGVACDLAMGEAGLEFRATKDLDIVLCAEVIDAGFVSRFWQFVQDGGYEQREKSSGERQYYRFTKPGNPAFPVILELFSRQPDGLTLTGGGNLTPIPVDDDVSSLSAILLDADYYPCIELGKLIVDGLSILGPEYIVVFKARAWLDLSARKAAGEVVDSRNIKKHRNDVFRIFQLLSPQQRVDISPPIREDMQAFVSAMRRETGLELKNLGFRQAKLEQILSSLVDIYQLELKE